MNKEVYIVAHKRTPIGSFCSTFNTFSGTELAAFAIKGALSSVNLNPDEV